MQFTECLHLSCQPAALFMPPLIIGPLLIFLYRGSTKVIKHSTKWRALIYASTYYWTIAYFIVSYIYFEGPKPATRVG